MAANAENNSGTEREVTANVDPDEALIVEKETVNELDSDNSKQPHDEQQQTLSDFKAATLKLLDSITCSTSESDIDHKPLASQEMVASVESQVTSRTNTGEEPTSVVDLTTSESAELVTVISDSSQSNSQSSVKDCEKDPEMSVDLTNEIDSSSSSLIEEIAETSKGLVQSESDEPPSKRSRLEFDSVVLEDSACSNLPSDDVVIVSTDNLPAQSMSNQIDTDVATTIDRESVFDFKGPPRQVTGAWEAFKDPEKRNYLRGCKWAPDGTCLLTNSNDNKLRIFNLPEELYYEGGENKIIPEMIAVVQMKEADTVYDFSWYPLMSSTHPETACLAVSSKDTPIHLYDAFTGDLRCSYRAYNHVDEVVAAYCVEFSRDGNSLYCGFNKMIRVFDVTRPGREFQNRPTFAKDGQRGIISCIDCSPAETGLCAAGSYSRSIALYEEPAGSMVCMFEGQQGGVTQVKFSPDGTKLYSGGRKDNEILCWDLRNPGQILFSLLRSVLTNQRIYFDITRDGRYVVSGSSDGSVQVWDTTSPPVQHNELQDPVIKPLIVFDAHSDCVNGISLNPTLPMIATASGQRHFQSADSEDENTEGSGRSEIDNSLRLWWT